MGTPSPSVSDGTPTVLPDPTAQPATPTASATLPPPTSSRSSSTPTPSPGTPTGLPPSRTVVPDPTTTTSPVASPPVRYAPGRLVVKYRFGAVHGSDVVAAQGLQVLRSIGSTGLQLLQTAPGHEQEAMEQLRRSPLVESVELDYAVHADTVPVDPSFRSQWDLIKINMPTAWDVTLGSATALVAVIDSGIDLSHPDLDQQWIYAREKTPAQHVFLSDPDPGCAPALTPDDDTWSAGGFTHGTHVAGTIAAESTLHGDAAVGIAGIAPGTKILPLKVLDCAGSGYFSDVAEAIDFASLNGASVINLSLGANLSACPIDAQAAIDLAWTRGSVVTAAAGNSGTSEISYPGGCNHVIGVGSTDSADLIANKSQHNGTVALAAPGVSILSTGRCRQVPPGVPTSCSPGSHTYLTASGTSMSAPHVAGCSALLRSINPSLGPGEVEIVLRSTALDLGTTGRDDYFGSGRLDCGAAVRAAVQTVPTPTPTSTVVTVPSVSRPHLSIDVPAELADVSGIVTIQGWGLDLGASSGPGLDAIDVYLDAPYPTGTFLGHAIYGIARSDVATFFGSSQFTNSGWQLSWASQEVSHGDHSLFIYGHSTVTGSWVLRSRAFKVGAAPAPLLGIDWPPAGATLEGTSTVQGWALDLNTSEGTGVDQVHIYRDGPYPLGTFLGIASYGLERADVASFFGSSQLTDSGWSFDWDSRGTASGAHSLYVYAHSSVNGTWTLAVRPFTLAVSPTATPSPTGTPSPTPTELATATLSPTATATTGSNAR